MDKFKSYSEQIATNECITCLKIKPPEEICLRTYRCNECQKAFDKNVPKFAIIDGKKIPIHGTITEYMKLVDYEKRMQHEAKHPYKDKMADLFDI